MRKQWGIGLMSMAIAIAASPAVTGLGDAALAAEEVAGERTAAASPTAVAARRPAGLSGDFRRTRSDRLRVTIECPCRRVTLTYRVGGTRKKRTLRLRAGSAQILLPGTARRIQATSEATSTRRAGRIVVRRAPLNPQPTKPTKPAPQRPIAPPPTPPPPVSDPAKVFRMVIVPDTQHETKARPDLYTGRMQWIADNAEALRVRHVIQVGDLVDTDNCGIGSILFVADDPLRPQCDETMRANNVFYPMPTNESHYQYVTASSGLSLLDAANVPYTLTVGNHDTAAVCGGPACLGRNPDWGVPEGTTTYSLLRSVGTWNSFFPPSRFPSATTYEPTSTANLYRTFSAGGLDWLVLSLELWPRREVVDWAGQVVASHPHHNVIITTHHYLNTRGEIAVKQDGYGSTTPIYLWENLVKLHPNIRFVFSGHVGSPSDRVDVGVNGNKIQSIQTCYHDRSNAQTMLLTIDPDANSAQALTYINPGSTTTMPDTDVNVTGMSWVEPAAGG